MRQQKTSNRVGNLQRMSEWLDIMLGEIARKKDEEKAAREESARREKSETEDQEKNLK